MKDGALEPEEWAPVVGYEDRYEVSRLGEVRSVDFVITDVLGRSRRQRGRLLKQTVCDFGYHRVELRSGGRVTRRSYQVHRLVAMAFSVGGNGPEVMHLDHNPHHNHAGNLEWGTHSENVKATVQAGRYVSRHAHKVKCPQGHDYSGVNSRGERICHICKRDQQRTYKQWRAL